MHTTAEPGKDKTKVEKISLETKSAGEPEAKVKPEDLWTEVKAEGVTKMEELKGQRTPVEPNN